MTIFYGRITAYIGEYVADKETLTNVKIAQWRRITNITPKTVMNYVLPVGWYQGHKHVEVELHVVSEAYHAFYHNGTTNKAYIKEDADNIIIPYFVVTIMDMDAHLWTATFTDAIPLGPAESYREGDVSIFVYRLLATKVVLTAP